MNALKVANGLILDFTVPSGGSSDAFLAVKTDGSISKYASLPVNRLAPQTPSVAAIYDSSGYLSSSSVTAVELGYVSGVTSGIQAQLNSKQGTINLTANRLVISSGAGALAVSATTNVEAGYLSGVTSAIQTQINSKQATITGAATSIVSSNLTASRALISDGSGKVAVSSVTSTELGYSSGVTSAIQTQLNSKLTVVLTSPANGDFMTFNGTNWVNTPSPASSLPAGGTVGQFLYKNSSTNYDTSWKTLLLSNISNVNATAAEVNILSGVTTSTVQLNYLNTLTSNVQSQLSSKLSTSLANNSILVGNISNIAQQLPPGPSGYVLTSVGGTPQWQPSAGGGSGIVGPGTTTNNAVVRWSGTTGGVIQDSVVIIDASGNVNGATWLSNKIGLAYGGTNADLSATGGAGQYLKQSTSGGAVSVGVIPASDIGSGAALTKTDDTNVTLTLGGTPTTSLLAATSLTLGWTGVLSVARGGTSFATYTIGDILQASGTGAFSKLAAVATGNVIISGGVGTVSSWGKVGLATHVSGTLPQANGGTGFSTYTTGDTFYASATNTLSKLPVGANGSIYTVSAGLPAWGSLASIPYPINGLTGATGTNSIDNGDNFQYWQWTNLSATGLSIISTSTAAAGNNQILFTAGLGGANANSTQTTVAGQFNNSHTGTASTNVAIQAIATGGTNNYAGLFTGFVGIGTLAPTADLHVAGVFRYVDGNQGAGKFLGSDASGNATWQTVAGGGLTASNGLAITAGNIALTNVYVVTTIAALQTYLSGLGAGADVNIKFPIGSYTVTSVISISNKGKVVIDSDDATLVNAVGASSSVIDISTVTSVFIRGLNIDMNATTQANNNGIKINAVSATVRIEECDIFHFPKTFVTTVIGILLDSSPTASATAPGTTITNCNFYNSVTGGVYNYTSNNNGGTAIKLNSVAEYSKIANNSFVGLSIPIWLVNGANAAISNCDFQENLPYFGSTKYGCIYMQDNAANIGKLNISNCKFNHNWGHCIFPNYSTLAFNPFTVTGCDFITNAIAPIRIGSTGSNSVQGAIITGNNFRTSNASQTATNNPFTTADCCYIVMFNANNLITGNIFSAGTSSQPAIVSGGTASGSTIRNNYYDPSLTFTSLVGTNIVMMNERKVTFLPDGTNAGINVGGVSSAPSALTNGDIYYDTTLNGLYAQVNGSTILLGGAGAASWGSISGTLSAQTDLQTALNGKVSTTLTNAHILVGNGSGIATDVAASLDVSLANTGAFTVTGLNGNALPANAAGALTNNGSGVWSYVAAGGGTWGSITGTLSSQTDLQTALNGKLSTSLASASIFVGNGSGVATAVAASGDVTLANTGAFSVTKILGNTVPANASGVLTNNGTGTLTWAAAGGTGTVTSVTNATGEITVATTTTTPLLTIVSAPKLTTARTIQGVSFDGSANITTLTSGSGTTVSGTAVNLGGTLTGLAAIVSNAKNQLTVGGSWTSTLVGDNMMAFGGTITSASAVGATGYVFNPAMAAVGTSSVQVALDVVPTFSGGTTPVNISFRVQNGVSIFGNFSAPINTETLLVRNDQNASTSAYVVNNTNGTTAFAQFGVSSTAALTGAIYLRSFSANYTTTANYNIANTTALVSAATVETNIVVAGNTPLSFWTNATRRASFLGGGAFLLGYTTAISTEQLGVRTDQNNSTNILIENATSGIAARAELIISGSSTLATTVTLTAFSAAFTTSGSQVASTGVLRTSLTGGLNLSAAASGSQLSLWTGDVKRLSIDGSGNFTFTQGAQTSAWGKTILTAPGAHTGLTTATEFIDYDFGTRTVTQTSGTTATQRWAYFRGQTYAGTTATATITDAYTIYIDPAVVGTNAAITRNWAAGINGNLTVSGKTYHGALGVGPTALLHLAAGTTGAGTSPLKFTSGSLMSSVEVGAFEYDGTNIYLSDASVRYTIIKAITNSATLDFPSTGAGSTSDLTITVTGAAVGEEVVLGSPTPPTGGSYSAFVSATNTVTIRFTNPTIGALDPASATFKVSVIKR